VLKKFTHAALARMPSTIAANMDKKPELSIFTDQSRFANLFASTNKRALRKLHAERAKKRSPTRPMLRIANMMMIATNSA
jgi:hypothetical protein